MIGSVKMTYDNENICQLVRKDLVDKFGNRELANYNLYQPGVVVPKAKISTFPEPNIKKISVESQLKDMGVTILPTVPRSSNTVTLDDSGLGGHDIGGTFTQKTNTFLITGNLSYSSLKDVEKYNLKTAGHWIGVSIGFPTGFTFNEGDIVSYTENEVPKYFVLTEDNITNNSVTLYFDGAYTTHQLSIGWNEDYKPEKMLIRIISSLAEDGIYKYPDFPTEDKYEFIWPETVEATSVEVDVDLDMGKD